MCCLLGSMLHPSVQGAQVDARNARQFHQQAQVQQQQYAVPQERQGLGGNVDFTTPIGSFQAGGNLGLQPNQGENGLLTNGVIALGVLSLVNTVATVASGWFGNKDDDDDKDKEDGCVENDNCNVGNNEVCSTTTNQCECAEGFSRLDVDQKCTATAANTQHQCPRYHPYAYLSGSYCCATNEEKPNGGNESEIASGTCDGHAFNIESTCCKDDQYIKCEFDSCIDHDCREWLDCANQGTCNDDGTCTCFDGYAGPDCSIPCDLIGGCSSFTMLRGQDASFVKPLETTEAADIMDQSVE